MLRRESATLGGCQVAARKMVNLLGFRGQRLLHFIHFFEGGFGSFINVLKVPIGAAHRALDRLHPSCCHVRSEELLDVSEVREERSELFRGLHEGCLYLVIALLD